MKSTCFGVVILATVLITGITAVATCIPTIPATAPAARFSINKSDGTVTDGATTLVWKICSEGQTWNSTTLTCDGTATTYTWGNALGRGGSTFAGKSDWRVPNIKELDTIVERSCYTPAIDLAVFPGTLSGDYWTSSGISGQGAYALDISFDTGLDANTLKTTSMNVRLVRGGF